MTDKPQQSIHPRVVNGHTIHAKKNTAMPRRSKLTPERAQGLRKHCQENPNDVLSLARLAKAGG